MVYEFVIKLFGKGAADIISLLPFILSYEGDTFSVSVPLNKPYTNEIIELIESPYPLTLECQLSLLINDKYLFKQKLEKRVTYQDGWFLENTYRGIKAPEKELFQFSFTGFNFDAGDEIDIFSVVSIQEDSIFQKSTGLSTAVLWNYVTPSQEEVYTFSSGGFQLVDH